MYTNKIMRSFRPFLSRSWFSRGQLWRVWHKTLKARTSRRPDFQIPGIDLQRLVYTPGNVLRPVLTLRIHFEGLGLQLWMHFPSEELSCECHSNYRFIFKIHLNVSTYFMFLPDRRHSYQRQKKENMQLLYLQFVSL